MKLRKNLFTPPLPPWLIDAVLSLLASCILATVVPWKIVLLPTTLCGGDNPAHPVLMQSLSESFFSHLSLIHYSYKFWGGFEAFQFYFPLPYLFGAILAKIIHPGVAFKLVTLFGILGLPFAFYWMAADLQFSRVGRLLASLLSVPFLFTNAHVMWGGNVYSALAGMIGNAWGFVFLVFAFGKILRSYMERSFSILALAFCLLAALSHFYAILILAVLFGSLAVFDSVQWIVRRERPALGVYWIGASLVLLMAWWLLPLMHYAKYSSDLGGNWNIELLKTFTVPEKIAVCLSFLIGMWMLVRTRFAHAVYGAAFLFLGMNLFCFYFNRLFNTSVAAFLDIRLWPSIYFGLYLLIILAVETLYQSLPLTLFPLLLCGCYFLVPQGTDFNKAQSWMQWNYRGIETSQGWGELKSALQQIENDPTARISYEANGSYANRTFGSVRAMELLPYLTRHELILGGIVNSASYAGIGYFLQCLMSNEGADWPPGSVMPAKDIPRGIEFMKALGIQYHIAFDKGNRQILDRNPEVQKLFDGSTLALYTLKEKVRMVEVYSDALPAFYSPAYRSTLLNLPRWDAMRNAGILFFPSRAPAVSGLNQPLPFEPFLNFLAAQWNAKKRVFDMGWQDRKDRIQSKLNLFLFFRGTQFDPAKIGAEGTEFMIADRGFDPELYMLKGQEKYSEVAVPLLRSRPGESSLVINGNGYRAFVNGLPVPIGSPARIEFPLQGSGAEAAPFAWLVLKPEGPYHYAELSSTDPDLQSRFPGPSDIQLPARITDACQVQLERSFQRIVLHTSCPGKPHLIKFSYYPKWKSDVPISIGTNGFMVLTPRQETTVLVHTSGPIDLLGQGITALTAVALWILCGFFRKSSARRPREVSYDLLGSPSPNREDA